MLRAGVIGGGSMGRNHIRVLRDLYDLVELVGVAEPSETARAALRKAGTTLYARPEHLLEQERPDLVIVAVPTAEHARVGLVALRYGCHVLIEKPIASTEQEGRALIDEAARQGLLLAVGHIERHNPAIVELKRRLEAAELGHVFEAHVRRIGPFPTRIRDVGVVLDLATHDIDVLRYLLDGEVERVYAETERRIHTDHEDLLSALLRFTGGAVAALDINWLTPTKVRELSITGERGMFTVNYLTQELTFYENDATDITWVALRTIKGVSEGNMTRLKIQRQEPLCVELMDFLSAIRDGRHPLVRGEDGLAALRIAQTIVRSGKEHAVLPVEV
jgi:UDP-N-acetylglucosamine 3-dehydrogenase